MTFGRRLDGEIVGAERDVYAWHQPRLAFRSAVDRKLSFRRLDEDAVALAIDRSVVERHAWIGKVDFTLRATAEANQVALDRALAAQHLALAVAGNGDDQNAHRGCSTHQ